MSLQPAITEAGELPVHNMLPGLILMRDGIARKMTALSEEKAHLDAAIEHIRRSIGVSEPVASPLDETERLLGGGKPASITAARVVQVLRSADRPLNLYEIGGMLRPDGDKRKTYSSVQRVIERVSEGKPSLIDRGIVEVDRTVRPLIVSLTAAAKAQFESEASKA